MLLIRLLILVPLVQVEPFAMPSLSDLWKMAKFGYNVGSKIKEGYDIYELFTDDTSERIDKILDQVAEVSTKIDGFESRLDQRLDVIVESLVSRITLIQKLDTTFMELHKIIVSVDRLWETYLKYSKNYKSFNNATLKEFIAYATGIQDRDLEGRLSQVHRLIVPLRTAHIRDSLFLTMLKNEKENELITCDEGNSHQQIIFQIYYTVALTELRGFIMAAWAYGIRPRFEKGTYTAEVNDLEARFTMRTRDYLLSTKEAMKIASTSIRRCDPKGGHIKGLTYAEFDELFHTYVINEADIDRWDSCERTCETIGTQTYRRRHDTYLNYNYDRPCWGSITGCRKGGGKMTVCDTRNSSNSRRYYWFKESNGDVAGDDSAGCPGQLNWPKGWPRGIWSCDYCVCTCQADRNITRAKRAISLAWEYSNRLQNMVVTGVRFVQKDRMIHIQIREGKLQPEGRILKGSDRWLPVKQYEYTTAGENGSYSLVLGKKKREPLEMGRDFEFIRGDIRIFNLDDVLVPKDHIVVGVRFNHVKDWWIKQDNPIRIEVYSAPYDYEEGFVKVEYRDPVTWIAIDSDKKRTSVKFDHPDLPTKNGLNVPTLRPNLFVKIQESDLKKDAGQSTIPFWDIQDVVTSPSSPLQGIGFFHKGHRDGLYGGYLALRLHSLDFVDNLKTKLPDDLKKLYEEKYQKPMYSPVSSL